MKYGLILPTKKPGANPEAILATTQAAERLGFERVWSDDHILVPGGDSGPYAWIYEIITTLAWLGGQTSRIRLGTGVVVVPQRNAIIMAKQLATVDALTGGRVIAGFGLGWNEQEYRNLGMAERFRVRGAFLDETIALCRHLWSGDERPFQGRFHRFENAVMAPPPAQGGALPIFVGGRSDAGVRRAGRLADGYHLSQNGPAGLAARLPLLRQSAAEAGRPVPPVSARVPVYFGDAPAGVTPAAMSGTHEQLMATIDEWDALGVDELAFDMDEVDARRAVDKLERFHREILLPREVRLGVS